MQIQDRKKVLILSTSMRPGGGPQGYVYNLKVGLSNIKNSEVTINFWSKFNDTTRSNKTSKLTNKLVSKLPSIVLEILFILKSISDFIQFWINKELNQQINKNDIIIINDHSFYYLIHKIKKLEKIFIFMQHTPTQWTEEVLSTFPSVKKDRRLLKKFLLKVEKDFFEKADKVILPSYHAIDGYMLFPKSFIEKIHKKSLYILSGAPYLERNSHNLTNHNFNKINITYLGRYHTHKGFDTFLDIVKKSKNLTNIHFFCAGSGNIVPPDLENLTNIGWTQNVGELISKSHLVICPNKYTYFDLLPLEVMSQGVALILSPVGGNIDLATYSNGILIPENGNKEDYISLIKKINEGIFDLEELGKINKEAYKENFTLEKFAKRYIDILNNLR